VRALRHLHDLVRQHHDQSGAHVSKRGPSGEHGERSQRAQLPFGARTLPPLHTQHALDSHQRHLRGAHALPPEKVAQGPNESQRRSGERGCQVEKHETFNASHFSIP